MKSSPKLYALCTLSTGLGILESVKDRLCGVIGLSERVSTDALSGYQCMAPWCLRNAIPFIAVTDYGLKANEDKQILLDLDIDLLLVCGWQRLIPKWLIDHCATAALGVHGSAYGITGGRGRSPQNWALLMGKKEFSVALFKIDEGIDSGAVFSSRTFSYAPDDTIRTSYDKVCACVGDMVNNLLDGNMDDLDAMAIRQKEMPQYLPQRRPEDGAIDWTRSAEQIHDFIRALTRPYPCAFSFRRNGGKLVVIAGNQLPETESSMPPGHIEHMETDGILIATGKGLYRIAEYEVEGPPLQAGEQLASANFVDQMRGIIERHTKRYPDQAIADDLLRLAYPQKG